MAKSSRPIRYRSNPPLWGFVNDGKKVMDAVTGFYTYEDFLVANDFGDLVDSRGDGLDRNESLPTVSEQFGG